MELPPPKAREPVHPGEHVEGGGGDVDGAPSSAFSAPILGPWSTITERVINVDPKTTFERLESQLAIGDHTSYAEIASALEVADRRFFEASILVRAAKLAEQEADREIQLKLEVLRTEARSKIESEKRAAAQASGSKSLGKATLEEVRDAVMATWPDEVRSLERRSEEFHAARAVVEELATAWRSRASSLRTLAEGLRGR